MVPLSGNAYIAIEKYLSGAAVNAREIPSGGQFAIPGTLTHYKNLGINASQLYLAEDLSQRPSGTGSGAAVAAPTPAGIMRIRARRRRAHDIGFAGFIGYGWEHNQMHVSERTRCSSSNVHIADAAVALRFL